MKRLRIGFLGFDGVTGLDLIGPLEAFANALMPEPHGRRVPLYETVLVGVTEKPFRAESGVVFTPSTTIKTASLLDTLIIPGGSGLRAPVVAKTVSEWVKAEAPRIRRIASVCTGIYGLAPTGLLDGRHVTTHWRFTRDITDKFPNLKVDPDAIFLKDGPYYTSAGITAGIDLALALIEEDFGPTVALAVARELVVYVKRLGGQAQYSEPLNFQAHSNDRFAELASWMATNLRADLSVQALAARAYLCPRHFSRQFKAVFGDSPAHFVEVLRLDAPRDRLLSKGQTVDGVSRSVGFASADSFRRAFERQFGVPPTHYRQRFQV